MITLALDTSTPRGAVALLRDDQPLAENIFRRDVPGEHLFGALPQLLAGQSIKPSEIELLAVGIGPGSFTGIRAGIAAVKGLALPQHRPIKAVSSLDAIALAALPQIPVDCPQLCVLGDARREEIYYAIYDRTGRRVRPCQIAPLEALMDEIHAPLWFVSSAIEEFADDLRASLGGFASICPEPVFPSAAALGWLARQRYRADGEQGDERIEPLYLREPQYKKSG